MAATLTPPRAAAGFTLVELLVASTVTVMIAAAALMILRGTTAARERIDQQRQWQQQARASAQAVAIALRNAYRPADLEDALIVGEDDWHGDLPRDRVRFFSVSRRTIRADQPESDVREVEFFILDPMLSASAAPDGTVQPPALMRRIDPTRNPEPDGGGVLERVAPHIIGLNLTYHDGVQWRDEWTEQDGWPVAVKVEVLVDGQGTPIMATRLVNFPRYGDEPADDAAPQEVAEE